MDVVGRRIGLTAWGRLYGFDKATPARRHHAGRVPPEQRLPNGHCHVAVLPGNDGRCVVYARVSSADQKDDLDRQVDRPTEVVKAIGSGLHSHRRRWGRPVADHTVGTIVVEPRTRLSRFGFEYVEAALAVRQEG